MLNENQAKAVNSDADKIVVIAAAGSGKTKTFIERVSRLVDEVGVDVTSILALTFTNAAAYEMRDRYRKLHPNQNTPTFVTFHAFCYQILASNNEVRKRYGYFRGCPRVATDSDIKRITATCKKKLGTKLSDEKLDIHAKISKKEELERSIFNKEFGRQLRMENLITFQMMAHCVSKLFSINDQLIQPYKERYKYIFVDEFQDTDSEQWEFVKCFDNAKLYVTGDAKQNLYSFRGTDSSIIKSLVESDEWETVKLDHNYRSTKQICDFSNVIHESWGDSEYNMMAISDKSGIDVDVRFKINLTSEDDIKMLHSDIEKYKDVAILCRTNAEVDKICSDLLKAGIKFKTKESKNDASDIVRCAIDSEFCIDFLSNHLKADDYNQYIMYCFTDTKYKEESEFLKLYSIKLSRYTDRIQAIRLVLESNFSESEKAKSICNILKINQDSDDAYNGEPIAEYIERLSNKNHVESSVYVGTVHSVKGLEYNCVYLTGVNGKYFNIDSDDNKNIYYVGCTRAKEKLVVFDMENVK